MWKLSTKRGVSYRRYVQNSPGTAKNSNTGGHPSANECHSLLQNPFYVGIYPYQHLMFYSVAQRFSLRKSLGYFSISWSRFSKVIKSGFRTKPNLSFIANIGIFLESFSALMSVYPLAWAYAMPRIFIANPIP